VGHVPRNPCFLGGSGHNRFRPPIRDGRAVVVNAHERSHCWRQSDELDLTFRPRGNRTWQLGRMAGGASVAEAPQGPGRSGECNRGPYDSPAMALRAVIIYMPAHFNYMPRLY
jgi:hypothetical protein